MRGESTLERNSSGPTKGQRLREKPLYQRGSKIDSELAKERKSMPPKEKKSNNAEKKKQLPAKKGGDGSSSPARRSSEALNDCRKGSVGGEPISGRRKCMPGRQEKKPKKSKR